MFIGMRPMKNEKKKHIGIIIHIDARMAYTNDLSLIACKYSLVRIWFRWFFFIEWNNSDFHAENEMK